MTTRNIGAKRMEEKTKEKDKCSTQRRLLILHHARIKFFSGISLVNNFFSPWAFFKRERNREEILSKQTEYCSGYTRCSLFVSILPFVLYSLSNILKVSWTNAFRAALPRMIWKIWYTDKMMKNGLPVEMKFENRKAISFSLRTSMCTIGHFDRTHLHGFRHHHKWLYTTWPCACVLLPTVCGSTHSTSLDTSWTSARCAINLWVPTTQHQCLLDA